MKLNIAVVAGGYSHEKVVSLKSVTTLLNHLDRAKYNLYKVIIDSEGWRVEDEDDLFQIDKNDFSFSKEGTKINFDFSFITIHGTPGEDGRLQAYFDLVNIPYSTPSYLSSSITSNKFVCNSFLTNNGFNCAKSKVFRKGQTWNASEIIMDLGLPCFVKPVDGGSSFGVSKVTEESQLDEAINHSLEHGSESMIESFVDGVEVTCGVYTREGEVFVLPVTEIEAENEFFDFEAKYKGKSKEITPARLSLDLTKKVQQLTKEAYLTLGLKGMSRIDYIIQGDVPFLIEVNTTPGLSEQSIIPQQVRYEGYSLKEFFGWCVTI